MDMKKELRILKALTKILGKPLEEFKKKLPKDVAIMNEELSLMIISNDDSTKQILKRWMTEDGGGKWNGYKIPELDYINKKGMEATARYDLNHIKRIMSLMDCSDDSHLIMTLKKDFPVTFENYDFKVILAPRMFDD